MKTLFFNLVLLLFCTQFLFSQDKELNSLYVEINQGLEHHEKIDYFVVIKDIWTMENDMLTPTMKIKRNKIEAKYEPYLDNWIKQGKDVIWE